MFQVQVSSMGRTFQNYINSIQIDPKYILSSMTILVLFVKYNKNTPNSGKSIEIHFKKQIQNTGGLVRDLSN